MNPDDDKSKDNGISPGIKLVESNMNIVIQENLSIEKKNNVIAEISNTRGMKEEDNNKVCNYETFESSSEDEFSQGAYESAAQSFQNKEKILD
jgi:hypothetical protein